MIPLRQLMVFLITGCMGIGSNAIAADQQDLIQLLDSRQCQECQLSEVELTHANLRDANLQRARLQRANLSQAQLDGADLSGSDLSFTSFQGASLRGANLRNSRLIGTDFRSADLTGALLNQHALDQSHWYGARGVSQGARSHAGLHNAGVDAAQEGRWPIAEQLFSDAIAANPDEPLSWVARGLSRGKQGKGDLASRDLAHAGQLFADQGDLIKADQLEQASLVFHNIPKASNPPSGNGLGSALLNGVLHTAQLLAPLTLKSLMPMMP